MEFSKKLQELRKKKGLTQEELGESLYVTRTAISKWESGRGYPNIESLKAIASFFGITVDELLSCEEKLNVTKQDGKRRENRVKDFVCGIIDLSGILLLFLPFFAQTVNGVVYEVSLLGLTGKEPYLIVAYYVYVAIIMSFGSLQLGLINWKNGSWIRRKFKISLIINTVGVVLFIVSLQPYASILVFLFLTIKVFVIKI